MKFIKSMSFTNGWVKKTILSIFSIWMFLILLGALNDINLNPWGLSSYIVGIGLALLLIWLIIKKTNLSILIKKHQKLLIGIFIIIAFVWQVLMVLKLSSTIGWDVGTIHDSLFNKKTCNTYLSQNPNNVFLFYFQYFIFHLININKPNWIAVNILNLVCLDLSFLINAFSIRLIKKKAIKPLLIIQAILMITTAQVIVPYSDIMVLPFLSLTLLGFIVTQKYNKLSYKFIGVLLFSVSSLCTYLMKPSAFIPVIAIIIWSILHFVRGSLNKNRIINYVLSAIIFLFVLIGGISSFNHFEYSNNGITHVKKGMGEPMDHFFAMGLTAPGNWNPEQVFKTNSMKTVKERSTYSKHIIKQRLSDNGILGMIQYFITKNYGNTSDGTFGWYRGDGPYIENSHKIKCNKFTMNIVDIFTIISSLLKLYIYS